MKGIIIDGVAGSGKTTILKKVHSRIFKIEPSATKLFISEHYTERMLEHLKENGKLDGKYIKNHTEKIIGTLAAYQDMLNGSKFSTDPKGVEIFATLERFILTHFSSMHIENKYSIGEAKSHYETLARMGIKQVVLTVPESRMKKQILSTLNYRNEVWKDYLYSKGDEREIINGYIQWQKNFMKYVNIFRDSIDTTIIEVKDKNYNSYSDRIFDLLNVNQ